MPGQSDRSLESATIRMGLSEREVERRLRFVDFTPDDATRVTALTDVIVTHVDELVSAFFSSISRGSRRPQRWFTTLR